MTVHDNSGSYARDWETWHDHSAVTRAERYARFTDPALMQDPISLGLSATDTPDTVDHDYQSLGAILLNSLGAKMAGMLFPLNQPNFRLTVSDELQAYADKMGWDPARLQNAMAKTERKSSERLYYGNSYTKLQRAIKLCISTGECLIYRDESLASLVVWNRHSYSVRRDAYGRPWKIILRQRFTHGNIPGAYRESILEVVNAVNDVPQDVEMYTQVEFAESTIPGMPRVATITHEVEGKLLPGLATVTPEHLCPIFIATWSVQDGEHYGRGLVENFVGDFSRLSALSEQSALYEIDSLTILNLVDSSLATNVEDYRQALTGDYLPGPAGAITAYDRGDYNKMNAINASLSMIGQRLSQAFMYSGVQRDSERTTATEVSLVAREADQALGGAYSQLAQSMQTPLAYLTMAELGDDVVSALLDGQYKPTIITGAQALSRSSDTQKLLELSQVAGAVVPVLAQIDRTLDPTKMIAALATNAGYSLDDLKKSPEQLQQDAEAAQAQAQAQAAASSALVSNAQAAQAALT